MCLVRPVLLYRNVHVFLRANKFIHSTFSFSRNFLTLRFLERRIYPPSMVLDSLQGVGHNLRMPDIAALPLSEIKPIVFR